MIDERTATLDKKKSLTELFTNYYTLSRRQFVFGYQSAPIYVCFAHLGLDHCNCKGKGLLVPCCTDTEGVEI